MPASTKRPLVVSGIVAFLILCTTGGVDGQLKSPAQNVAEELLEVVRSGDRTRIRAFIETRFTAAFISSAPMDHHVPIFASLGRQVEGLDIVSVKLDSETNASLILEGPGKRLQLTVRVEPEAPHKVAYLGWGNARGRTSRRGRLLTSAESSSGSPASLRSRGWSSWLEERRFSFTKPTERRTSPRAV